MNSAFIYHYFNSKAIKDWQKYTQKMLSSIELNFLASNHYTIADDVALQMLFTNPNIRHQRYTHQIFILVRLFTLK
jgi:hypothetical protein